MASTYSTSFRFELIATGEQSGSWGTTTNVNLGTLLEQAIGGYVSIAMSDANYTLSTANGSSDEARNMVVRLTGTLTATRNVSCPDGIEKLYVVENATTGGFAITFKTASGTGVSVPNGSILWLFSDGTNIREIAAISPQFTTIELGNASDTTLSRSSAGVLAVEGVTVPLNSITNTHTAQQIELGHASDTTISRNSAGVIAVEGVTVPLNSITNTHTAQQIELGHASDTTISRSSAGIIAVEGVTVPLNSTTNTHTAQQIELGHASDTTISRVSAGVIAVEGSTIARVSDVVGQQTIWVPAGAMTPTTTNGAASGTFETTTNDVMLRYLAFDSATREKAQFGIQMPKGWDEGTIIAQFVWTHPSTTTNFGVSWELAAVAFANDDPADTAFGTLQEIDDTGGTTYDIYITGETPAITVAGTPGAEEYVMFEVSRDPADAGDTMAVDAWLLGVKIHYTTDAAKDD